LTRPRRAVVCRRKERAMANATERRNARDAANGALLSAREAESRTRAKARAAMEEIEG